MRTYMADYSIEWSANGTTGTSCTVQGTSSALCELFRNLEIWKLKNCVRFKTYELWGNLNN